MTKDFGDMKEKVKIELDRATILVLGNVLVDLADKLLERGEISKAQAMSLWGLENAIESVCHDSFDPDYVKILEKAKLEMGEFE